MTIAAALLVPLLLLPGVIAAQSPTIPPGTRVRVETQPKTRVAGTLMSQTTDSIIVAAPDARRTVFASEAVTRIELSKGRSHVHGALRGMAVGAGVVGSGALLVMTAAYVGAGSGESSIAPLFAFTAAGAAVGAMYGAAIGLLFSVEQWSTVYSAPVRVSIRPLMSSAPGLGLSIRF